jgi:hypothetical protein
VVDADEARAMALALPGSTEQDHHGRPSFRVEGKIFATLWTATALNVMLVDDLIQAAVATSPNICSPRYWGKRLAAVRIDLDVADAALVGDMLQAAWSQRVPGHR